MYCVEFEIIEGRWMDENRNARYDTLEEGEDRIKAIKLKYSGISFNFRVSEVKE